MSELLCWLFKEFHGLKFHGNSFWQVSASEPELMVLLFAFRIPANGKQIMAEYPGFGPYKELGKGTIWSWLQKFDHKWLF